MIKTTLKTLAPLAIVALLWGAPAAAVTVDCDAGDTISDALKTTTNNLAVEFRGTCTEDIVLQRGNLRLRGLTGSGTPTLRGSITISASVLNTKPPRAGRVRMRTFLLDATGRDRGLTVGPNAVVDVRSVGVTGAEEAGIYVYSGGFLRLNDTDSDGNVGDGMIVRDGAVVELDGLANFRDNGGTGLKVINNATVSERNNDDAGAAVDRLVFARNGGDGLFISTGSSVESRGRLEAVENGGSGVTVGNGAVLVASGEVVADNNLGSGVLAFAARAAVTGGTLSASGNGVFGVLLSDQAILRILGTGTVTDNASGGALVSGSYLRVASGTLTPNSAQADLNFSNGSTGLFGGGVTATTLVCDEFTVLSASTPFSCPE